VILRLAAQRRDTGENIYNVVMAARRMVDAIAARARRSPFQAAQLGHETRVIQQLDLAAVNGGK
jgi:hypothetical protein